MGTTIRNFSYIFLTVFFVIILIVFGTNYVKQVTGANRLQNITRIQAQLNADNASRVKEGTFFISQADFESAVARDYSNNNNPGRIEELDDVSKGATARTDPKTESYYDTADDGIKFTYVVETDDKVTQADIDAKHTGLDGKVYNKSNIGDNKYVVKSLLNKDDNVIAIKAKTTLNGEPHTTNLVIITTVTSIK